MAEADVMEEMFTCSQCERDSTPLDASPPPPCGRTCERARKGSGQSYSSLLLRAIQGQFIASIDADELMDCEEISALLTDSETERVQRKVVNEGKIEGARCLLQCLKKKQGWFDQLLKALNNPRLKQQQLIQNFIQAKEKIDKRLQGSSNGDVFGGQDQDTREKTVAADSLHPPAHTHARCVVRSQSEPTGWCDHEYNEVVDSASLTTCSWFHGLVSREEAERKIKGREPGSFLVRKSPGRGHYTLSFRTQTTVAHLAIHEKADSNGRLFYGLGEDNTVRYSTVTELIGFYRKHPLVVQGQGPSGICLSKPVSCQLS